MIVRVITGIWVQGQGYWDSEIACDWYHWGDQWEIECWQEWDWVDGPEYWSYAHFNQNGFKLAKAISDVLDGNLSGLPAAIDILKEVLGVDIGGWDFGDWLPGSVSNEQQDAYTLVLSIVSTRDVTNNRTPACISQNVQYYQDRMNAYIAPDLLQEYGTLETRAAAKGLLNAAGIPVQ